MCEALIRVVDKINLDDPYKDCKLFKRGDIIALHEDGAPWGSEELANPDWRIVKFPSIPLAQAENYLAPEADANPAQPSRMLRLRKFMFNLDDLTLPLAFRTWLADATRVAPTRTINLTGAQLVAYMKARTAIPDPNILG